MPELKLPPLQETYHIRVKGELDPKWKDWFDDFRIIDQRDNETLLTGTVPDQAALHGVLAKIRDLGLHILLIERMGRKEGSQFPQ